MINTLEQARQVQENRIANGKAGHSKAVRTFCKRNLDLDVLADYKKYLTLKESLPFIPIIPKVEGDEDA
jgi:hypothetical protein